MQKRNLGMSGLKVAPLAFGCNVFGWTADAAMACRLLDAFVDQGLNLLDTADVYPVWHPGNVGGESETIIGNWLKQSGKRDKVVVATKVGMKMTATLGTENLSRKYIFDSVEKSLKRLQIDTIDLYQAHTDDPVTPLEETLEAFNDLIKQGKVRAIGASNYSSDRLKAALAVSKANGWARYESLQPEYNLYDRDGFEETLEPLCLDEGLGVISYFSLARGFLSGKYRSEADISQSPRGTGVKKYLNARGFAIVEALQQLANEHKSTPAQVAIAWLIARPSVTAPIASATTIAQLDDLIAAAQLELSTANIAELNRVSQF